MMSNPYSSVSSGAPVARGGPYPQGVAPQFNGMQVEMVQRLARRLKLWGGISVAVGTTALAGAVAGAMIMVAGFGQLLAEDIMMEIPLVLGLLGAAVIGIMVVYILYYLIPGIRYLRAGSAMQLAVSRSFADIPELMRSLNHVSRGFRFEAVIGAMLIGLMMIGFVATFASHAYLIGAL